MGRLALILRRLGVEIRVQKDVGALAAPACTVTGVEWWRDDFYTRVPRWYVVSWRGRALVRIPFRESIVGNYFKPAGDLVALVREMIEHGHVWIDATSRIFEPGCNVGRNLWWLQREFGSEVVGMDISPRAVELAVKKIWKSTDRVRFVVQDVLWPGALARFPDGYFDLVLTRWHLIHLPAGNRKTAGHPGRGSKAADSAFFDL